MSFLRTRCAIDEQGIGVLVETYQVLGVHAVRPRRLMRLDPDAARAFAAELLMAADKAEQEILLRTPCPEGKM